MTGKRFALAAAVLAATSAVLWSAPHPDQEKQQEKPVENRVFELRIYTAGPGKMDALNERFRKHTVKLLTKHGMELLGFWTDAKEPDRKLIYLVAHKSKAAADASWKAFRDDPAWVAARDQSELNGKLTEKVESIWLNPTDYSVLK